MVYPRGGCGGTMCHLFAHLLVCISQADLELASGGAGTLLVSLCNVMWRSFVWAGGLGCQFFASSWWFVSAKCDSSISARLLICGAHSVCFLPLVTIFDLLLLFILYGRCVTSVLTAFKSFCFFLIFSISILSQLRFVQII
jgi:hypothetical protein